MLHAIVLLAVLTRVEAASSADSPAEARFREKIVFFGSADGASSLIQTMNPDGTGLRSVLKLQGAISSGRVSPDGRSAAFSLQANGAKHPAVWILEPNGERRQIADKGLVTAWSPDGKSLACYRSERGEWESFLVEISTRMSRQLPSPKGDVVEDWSPDGKTLGIVAGNSQRTFRHSTKGTYPLRQVYLLKLDGTRQRLLTPDPTQDAIWPRFSPNGGRIAYYRRQYPDNVHSPIETLVTCAPDGSDAKTILSFAKLSDEQISVRPNGFPAWSPDGRSVAWLADRRRRDRRNLAPGVRIEWELIFVSEEGGAVRRLPLKQEGINSWGQIDWR